MASFVNLVAVSFALLALFCGVLGANKEVIALVGKEALLPCTINRETCGNFHSIKWYKGNQQVFVYSPGAGFRETKGDLVDRAQLDLDDNISNLKISPLHLSDGGKYKCEITFLEISKSCPLVQRVKLTPKVDCYDKNTDYPGNDIAKTYHIRQTAAECQHLCSKIKDCHFFTWSPNQHCYVKRSKSRSSYEDGAISGPKSCEGTPEALALAIPNSVAKTAHTTTTVPTTTTACVETIDQDTDYTGEDLFQYKDGVAVENSNNIEADSLEECRDICRATYRCKYWTFVRAWRIKCVLKYSQGEKMGNKIGKVSGNVCPE